MLMQLDAKMHSSLPRLSSGGFEALCTVILQGNLS